MDDERKRKMDGSSESSDAGQLSIQDSTQIYNAIPDIKQNLIKTKNDLNLKRDLVGDPYVDLKREPVYNDDVDYKELFESDFYCYTNIENKVNRDKSENKTDVSNTEFNKLAKDVFNICGKKYICATLVPLPPHKMLISCNRVIKNEFRDDIKSKINKSPYIKKAYSHNQEIHPVFLPSGSTECAHAEMYCLQWLFDHKESIEISNIKEISFSTSKIPCLLCHTLLVEFKKLYMPNLIFDKNHGNLCTKWSCKNFTFLTNEMYFKLHSNLIKEYSPYFEQSEDRKYKFSHKKFNERIFKSNDIEMLTSHYNQAMNLHTPTKPSDFSDEEILKTKKEPLCISVIKEKNCIENEESNYHYTVENDKEENKDSKACEDDIEFSGDVNKLLCNYEIKEINFTENEDGNSKACENED